MRYGNILRENDKQEIGCHRKLDAKVRGQWHKDVDGRGVIYDVWWLM